MPLPLKQRLTKAKVYIHCSDSGTINSWKILHLIFTKFHYKLQYTLHTVYVQIFTNSQLLRGQLHLKPKLSIFGALSQNYQHFFEKFLHPGANSACLHTTQAIARYFPPTIFWVLVIWISNKHHVYVGCKIVGNGKESEWRIISVFVCTALKVHSTLNISYATQFDYWLSPCNQQSLVFLLRALLSVTRQKPPQEMAVSGCSVAVWRSVNSLPGCVSTGHSNRKDPNKVSTGRQRGVFWTP